MNVSKYKSIISKEQFMKEALKEAEKAMNLGEIPIGAVIVKDGKIIARGFNRTELLKDATSHAEMNAIKEASSYFNSWRLSGCDMYVTTEPCAMCAGALILSRVESLYIGTENPKAGACVSLYKLLEDERLNHCVNVEVGILKDECRTILKDFFKIIRKRSIENNLEDKEE